MSKANGRKYDPLQALRRAAVGMCIEWSDKTPMEDADHIVNGTVTHSNPLLRLAAMKLWSSAFGYRLTTDLPAKWVVRIVGEFLYPDGTKQLEERELEAHCVLTQINDVALEQIQEIRRYGGGEYQTTHFHVRCAGL